jgi:nicotinamide mononucleotide adenylyltransferase
VYEFDRASRNLDLENYTVSENFTTHTIAPFTPEEDKRIEDLVDKFGLNFKLVTAYLNTSTFVLEILPALNLASSNAYMTLNSSMIVRTESHVFWRWKDYILPRTAAETAKATKRPNSPHSLLQTIKRFIDEKKPIPGRANEISVPEISGRAAGQTHSSHAKLVMEARAAFSAGAFGALVKERVTSDIGAAVINPELVARWADHQKADEMRRITLLKKKMLDEQQQREAVVRQQQHQAQQQIAQAAVAAAAATTVLPVLTTPPVGPIRSVSPAPPLSVPKHPAPLGGPNPATRPVCRL